jgi:hypothetical protein
MKDNSLVLLASLLFLVSLVTDAEAQGTAFAYQGRLADSGGTASGNYDLRVSLHTTELSGSPLAVLTNANVVASNGLFTTALDFGAAAFAGPARWLEIGVRTNGSSSDFTTLTPRQPITPTPYAIHASAFAGPVADTQLSPNIARLSADQMFIGTVAFNPLSGPPFTVGRSFSCSSKRSAAPATFVARLRVAANLARRRFQNEPRPGRRVIDAPAQVSGRGGLRRWLGL